MKILSIGNSFSQDAQRYLHRIAEKNGRKIKNCNLYIGGCTLRKHYFNIIDDEKAYQFQFNGEDTGIYVSIREALKSDEWDIVTIQQGSHQSFDFEKYYKDYIDEIVDYVRLYAPQAKLVVHQTWAYKDNSERLEKVGFKTTEDMFKAVQLCYREFAKQIDADGIIPSGAAMISAYRENSEIVHRDTFHASLGFGRYMLGLLWFLCLFGKGTQIEHIDSFDVPVSNEEIQLAERIARNLAVEI